MIKISKSPTADTRTCDWAKVTMGELLDSSRKHIDDVKKVGEAVAEALLVRIAHHDFDKILDIDSFYADFQTGFEKHEWWDRHRRLNRHHLNSPDGVPTSVDLIDVLEYIIDCVTAGLSRSGKVTEVEIDSDVLMRAFKNMVEVIKDSIEVEEE